MSQHPNNPNNPNNSNNSNNPNYPPAYQPQPKSGMSTGLLVGLIVGGVFVVVVAFVGIIGSGCLAGMMLPAIGNARQSAQQLKVSTQVQSIFQAINIYSANNNDMYPPTDGWDQALITPGFVPAEMFDSVRIEGTGNEMIYTPPPGKDGAPVGKMTDISLPGQWVLIREDETKLPPIALNINVGFADGTVQALSREQLAARLAAQIVTADAIKALK